MVNVETVDFINRWGFNKLTNIEMYQQLDLQGWQG
ncbi:MAG: hypothetical protein ACI934_000664 [Pseudohongiellaceae bacterium]|jgi:hypothetical protein|tara:strand:- start:917 stop:1021 length:105 start_codon:yes stop_codon:yes gene_type:complete